jgi:serine/threonine protein kinase
MISPDQNEQNEFELQLKTALSTAYEIERELGGGGMSRVFVATDRILGRKIVIKVLSPELTAEVNRGRFRREMQVAAQLQHPHIVPLLSAGEQDGLLYFTMPFIKGESLKTALELDGAMSLPEVVRVLNHVGEALAYAHEAGIVHRDIKPANILRSGSYALITDFGVAKALNAAMASSQAMTSTGMAIGTPAYMAPEQLAGDSAADHRIDIYAVGLLAYELLHGKSPFAAATPQRMLAAVLTQDPKPLSEVKPEVPRELSDLVMRCLSKEPEKRPATAKELLDDLALLPETAGEVRTIEHRVAHIVHTPTPTSGITPVVIRDPDHTASAPKSAAPPASEPVDAEPVDAEPAAQETASAHAFEPDPLAPVYVDQGYAPPKKSRSGVLAGVVTVAALAAFGGFLWSQRGGESAPIAADSTAVGMLVPDSMAMQAPVPSAAESAATVAVLPTVDSVAIRDSLRKARAEASKKAAARRDSLKKAAEAQTQVAQESPTSRARQAIAAMLSNAYASGEVNRGATRRGGVLGTRQRGDLQTQIDAIVPFLRQAGISYEQFKGIIAETGISLFDENGRMIPAALQQFASGG